MPDTPGRLLVKLINEEPETTPPSARFDRIAERLIAAHIDALTAAVEALDTHEGHAYEPGIEWLCVTSGDPPRSTDCGDDAAHYRLVDRAAVLAIFNGEPHDA